MWEDQPQICIRCTASGGRKRAHVLIKYVMDCKSLDATHKDQVELLRRLLEIEGVKKVFIGSGIRYDLALKDTSGYISQLCEHHVSGHLKVAPEHVVKHVTDIMHKPGKEVFEDFRKRFDAENKRLGKRAIYSSIFHVWSSRMHCGGYG